MDKFHQLIAKICQQENIKLQALSRGWLFRLEKPIETSRPTSTKKPVEHPAPTQTRYIFNNTLALNSHSSAAIATDKFATFEVLRATGVPTIDHAIIYPFDNHLSFAKNCNTPKYLQTFFEAHHQDIVLKPNCGLGGHGITHITSPEQFSSALNAAFSCSDSASLCPFYQIRREYRAVMLDGEPRLVYGKERGADWRFNLQHGAKVVDVDSKSELYNQLVVLARRTTNTLNLRFCSVDIIELDPSDPHAKHKPNQNTTRPSQPELLVIEVNSTVATSHYLEQRPAQANLVEAIYRDAILKMFEN